MRLLVEAGEAETEAGRTEEGFALPVAGEEEEEAEEEEGKEEAEWRVSAG